MAVLVGKTTHSLGYIPLYTHRPSPSLKPICGWEAMNVGYWSETGEGCNSSCASDFRSDEMFADS
jgi:hypothetical protein